MVSQISKDVNWVNDVCSSNLGTVAKINNTLYAIGGYTTLRDPSDPNSPGVSLANSYLYTIDLSGNSIDLGKDYGSIIKAQRLSDEVPRTIWANMFSSGGNQLHYFGGLQVPNPIYLANGTWDLRDRPPINDNLWTYEVGGSKWVDVDSSGNKLTTGLGKDVLGQAAKAQNYNTPTGGGWMYGGAVWAQTYQIGNRTVGNGTEFRELRDLLKSTSGSTADTYSMAKVNTTTATSATAVPRPAVQASMVFIPTLGDQGALVLLGGSTLSQVASMKQVQVYDIASKTWFTQTTSADNNKFPEDRTEGCTGVATARDGSSSNIYLYGGKIPNPSGSDPPFVTLGEVWVLSLPAFQWIRSGKDVAVTRVGHVCHVVQERYLVSYRGLGPTPCDNNGGLQVYDMNGMQWTTQLVSGTGYEVPETVYKVIGGSKLGGATNVTPAAGWVDDRLKQLFKYTPPSNTTSGATGTSSPSNSSDTAVKIAVPIVVIAFLAIALFAGFCCYKRRRREQVVETESSSAAVEMPLRDNHEHHDQDHHEYYGDHSSPQKYDPTRVGELDANYPPAYELPGMDSPGNKSHLSQSSPGAVVEGVHNSGNGDGTGVGQENGHNSGTHGTNDHNNHGNSGVVSVGESRDRERGYNA